MYAVDDSWRDADVWNAERQAAIDAAEDEDYWPFPAIDAAEDEDYWPFPGDPSYDYFIPCPQCDGEGQVWVEAEDDGPGHIEGHYQTCDFCGGRKWVRIEKKCRCGKTTGLTLCRVCYEYTCDDCAVYHRHEA